MNLYNINEKRYLSEQSFKSFYSNRVLQLPPETESKVRLGSISITEAQLVRALKTQNIMSGPGSDIAGISASLLFNCSATLTKPFLMIFDKSLRSRIFPNSLKKGYITPIHKSGDKQNIANYRPVSQLNSIVQNYSNLYFKLTMF